MALRRGGTSFIEILVVLAVLALVAGASFAVVRPSGAHQAALAARALVTWSRLQALRTNSDAALSSTAQGLVVHASGSAPRPCTIGRRLRGLAWSDFGSVRLERALRSGILWRADGIALSCAGGGVISDRLVLADDRARYAVVISSLGRVRVERLP